MDIARGKPWGARSARERGIAIFAPCVYRRRPVDDDEAARTPELARVLRGFRVAYVWDESQTDGDALPDIAPQLLAGEAPAGLWDSLAREVANAAYELRRGQCGGANGRTSYTTRTVTVRDDVDDAQATRTLMHELAHIWLHDPEEALHHRGTAEVEAESTAYVVCQAAGMVTDDYSLPYVASGRVVTRQRSGSLPSASSALPGERWRRSGSSRTPRRRRLYRSDTPAAARTVPVDLASSHS